MNKTKRNEEISGCCFLAPDDMCAIHAIHIFTEIGETCPEFALKIISGCALHARDKNHNANEDSLELFSSPWVFLLCCRLENRAILCNWNRFLTMMFFTHQ